MKRTLIVIALVLVHAMSLYAQDEHEAEKHELKYHNLFTLFAGNTLIQPSGFNLPTIGIEYVRELNHFLGIGIMAEAELITAEDLGLSVPDSDDEGLLLNLKAVRAKAEKGALQQALVMADGKVARAADLLGVSRPTLYGLLERHGLG